MKYLISAILLTGLSFAHGETLMDEEIEVGSPRDCVAVGTKNDTALNNELNQIQQQITDCLAPQEEEAQSDKNHPEVVSQ